jgi:catechol 2,3-dioxygenase-like lactoylglutathione lyase family enzyme
VFRTYGLTHVALAVADVERAAAFYQSALGMRVVYRDPSFVQLQTPATRDVLVLERDAKRAGRAGNVAHFGFRLVRAADIGVAADAVRRAGGRIRDQGEFVPGEPYLFALDPDGNEIEIWYELPTPIDPPARRRQSRPTARRRPGTRA